MIKFSATTDWDFGVETVALLRDAKTLTKRASASIKDQLKVEKTPNQTDVHIIALGAYEGTGFNRNLDCFLEEDCEKKYNTFTKAGRAVHRNHKNKKKDPKYGNIKAAAYNKDQKRIELIVGLDNDKCSDILDKIEKGEETSWSMASRQRFDCCSLCGHKAKDDNHRCEHIPNRLGEITKEGQIIGMINPDPDWFEISYVKRGADRLAFTLNKLASSSNLKPLLPSDYLKIYDGFCVPLEETLISKKASDKRALLSKLSVLEKRLDAVANGKIESTYDKVLRDEKSKLNAVPSLSKETIDELRKFEPAKLMKVLAEHGIILDSDEFSDYLFANRINKEDKEDAKSFLRSGFRDLEEGENDDAGEVLNSETFSPSFSSIIPPEIKKIVSSLFEDKSLMDGPAHNRVIHITIQGGLKQPQGLKKIEKKSHNKFASELAKQYLSYKLAALQHMQEKNILTDDILLNAVIQNWK